MTATDYLRKKTFPLFQYAMALILLALIFLAGIHSFTFLFLLLIVGSIFTFAFVASQTSLTSLFMITIVSMVFSVEMQIPDTTAILRVPSEPLLIIMALAFTFKQLKVFTFNLTDLAKSDNIVVALFILCMCLTTLTSSMPAVSIKASLIKTLYLFNFYFIVKYFVAQDKTIIFKWLDIISIIVVPLILYYSWKHSYYDFSKNAAGDIVKPLFNDHTIYSCFLAFLAPYNFLKFASLPLASRPFTKLFYGISFLLLISAIILSGCRAAWLSILAVIIAGMIIKLKINYKWVAAAILTISIYVVYNIDNYIANSKRNRYDSSAAFADLTTQAQSVTNINSDNSNLERLNRWSCAWRMFIQKPLTGFGPGTYQYQYLDFQQKSEMTPISVTSPYNIRQGHGGTAHQEYLLLLSEMGLAGFLFFVSLIVLSWKRAVKLLQITSSTNDTIIIASLFFAMLTYIVHALFNNFLDTDKTAFLFFASMACINQLYYSKITAESQ